MTSGELSKGAAGGLPAHDRAGRIGRLRESFAASSIEALLVTDLFNIRYLTGFAGSAAMLIVGRDDLVFVTDGRYEFMADAALEDAGLDAALEIGRAAEQMEALKSWCAGRSVGIESLHVSLARFEALTKELGTLTPTSGLVERLRRTKDEAELARIRRAAELAALAYDDVYAALHPGSTELEIAVALEARMRLAGADGPAFDTIVASGPHGANAHAVPRRAEIGDQPVVVDFGATFDGYRSDTTRTISTGRVEPVVAECWGAVYMAQQAGVALLTPGTPTFEIDKACRDVLAEVRLGEYFTTGVGHGVGLQIHENPFVPREDNQDVLQVGDIVTVEPGVYVEGRFGIRIEDFFLITPTGATCLSPMPLIPLVS